MSMKLSEAERRRRIEKMLEQIAPESNLDRLHEELQSASGDESLETLSVAGGTGSAAESLDVLRRGGMGAVDERHLESLEAIIHKKYRPAVFVKYDSFDTPPAPWKALGNADNRARINQAILSIGRIELPGNGSVPYGGTGFVVGPNLVMTNRHVAELFSRRMEKNEFVFKPNCGAAINFRREVIPSPDVRNLSVKRIVMIHPYWDMALLEVEGLSQQQSPLPLSTVHLEDLDDHDVVVIGYPAQDCRSDIEVQNRIFGGVFDVKRLLPGKLQARRQIKSFENVVNAATHDASTLGGSSGSAVVHVKTGEVVALHFAGEYLEANFAVPIFELAQDTQVVDAGVKFESAGSPSSDGRESGSTGQAVPKATGNSGQPDRNATSVSMNIGEWTIPIHISVRAGGAVPSSGQAASVSDHSELIRGRTPALSVGNTNGQPREVTEASSPSASPRSNVKDVSGEGAGPDTTVVPFDMPTDVPIDAGTETAGPGEAPPPVGNPDENESRGLKQILKWPRIALSRVGQAIAFVFVPVRDEEFLKSTVWYIESSFRDGAQQLGSAVVIRVSGAQGAKNMALTCQHVIRHAETGDPADSIRCWPHNSGYNPDSTSRIWRASPASIQGSVNADSRDFADVGGMDWVLLDVVKQGETFSAVPFAPGFAAAKWAVRQSYNPYRLIGYPDGMRTMHQDVVRASVSRDFRLPGTDSKSGQMVLDGPEETAPGLSGAPYFDDRGRIVAIHRSRGAAKKPVGIDASNIRNTINARGLSLVPQDQEWLLRWFVRRTSSLLFLVALVVVPIMMLDHYWQRSAPNPFTVFGIEKEKVVSAIKTQPAELVDPNPDPKARNARIVDDTVLEYIAAPFSDYAEKENYIAIDRLQYRRKLWGLKLPTSEITVRIRQHIDLDDIDQLYEKLKPLDDEKRKTWYEVQTRPVISINAIKVEPQNSKIWVYQTSDAVHFVQDKTDDKPRIELKLYVGKHSPVKTSFFYRDEKKERIYWAKNVVIRGDEHHRPEFEEEAWLIQLYPALSIQDKVIVAP